MIDSIRASLREGAEALANLIADRAAIEAIDRASEVLAGAFRSGGRVISCGNGGSMCDAMHLAEELSGRFRKERPALAAAAVSDPGHLSCAANDYGYERAFARWIEAHGRAGDVLVAISTSGRSSNVIAAAHAARSRGMQVVALTGRRGSDLGALAHVEICTPAGRWSDRIQELHIKVIHILIETVERRLFPENYRDEEA